MPQRIGDRVLLSTTEAVRISGLSRVHIQRLLRLEQVEGMKLGHDWLVFEDSLKSYLDQPRKPGPKPIQPEASNRQTEPIELPSAPSHDISDSHERKVKES